MVGGHLDFFQLSRGITLILRGGGNLSLLSDCLAVSTLADRPGLPQGYNPRNAGLLRWLIRTDSGYFPVFFPRGRERHRLGAVSAEAAAAPIAVMA